MVRRFPSFSSLTSDNNLNHKGVSNSNRLRLVVEYDGTDFAGFQWQANERTVQGELEAAIQKLGGREAVRIHGAGRTDAGVHAIGQVIHFDPNWTVPLNRVAIALNGVLPRDVSVRSAEATAADFHARFDATARTYRYVILNRAAPSALLSRYSLYLREPLNIAAMQNAAQELTGTRDFASFGQPDALGKSTIRDVTQITVRPFKQGIFITVREQRLFAANGTLFGRNAYPRWARET